jgi:hypothetical protein
VDNFLRKVTSRLLDERYWRELSGTPQKFRSELDDALAKTRELMTWRYAMPAHRSLVHSDRDQEIYEMRESSRDRGKEKALNTRQKESGDPREPQRVYRKSFREIGSALGMKSEQATQAAYERYVDRQRKILGRWFDFWAEFSRTTDESRRDQLLNDWLHFAEEYKLL